MLHIPWMKKNEVCMCVIQCFRIAILETALFSITQVNLPILYIRRQLLIFFLT